MYEGLLIWLSPAERPSARLYEEIERHDPARATRGSLRHLVCANLQPPEVGMLPWIKMPTGQGSAFFGVSEILAIRQAFCTA